MIPHYLNSSALLPIGFNISVEEALTGSRRNLSIGFNSSCSLDIEIAWPNLPHNRRPNTPVWLALCTLDHPTNASDFVALSDRSACPHITLTLLRNSTELCEVKFFNELDVFNANIVSTLTGNAVSYNYDYLPSFSYNKMYMLQIQDPRAFIQLNNYLYTCERFWGDNGLCISSPLSIPTLLTTDIKDPVAVGLSLFPTQADCASSL